MSTSYQCPNCGQIVPVLELDEIGPVHCPSCQGAMRSGPPPVSLPPPASDAQIVQPIPPWRAEQSAPARWADDEDPAEIDIRRHELLAAAPRHFGQSSGRAKHVIWPLIVIGIAALRLFGCALRNNQQVAPINFPQVQFQLPNQAFPNQPPGEPFFQRATWSEQLPDGLGASQLVLSGPLNPRIGIVAHDRAAAETVFIGFDGATGANAGRIVWEAPIRPVRFSLSDDGSRLAVLLQDRGLATKRFRLYALPGGEAVGGDWYPFRQANDAVTDDVWFALLGPDRLLTIFQQRQLELWSVPDRKRLYSVDLEPAPGKNRPAVAISPDRRLLAVANRTQGFTFHDTANGAILGRTAAVAGKVDELFNCAFSPDGKHLGCHLTVADPPLGQWVMWSCQGGAVEAQWDQAGVGTWLFWDDQHVFTQRALVNARNGITCGTVDINEQSFLAASSGRRLWYVCREPFALALAVQLASIELQPHWFQNPDPNVRLFRRWSLNRAGLSNAP